MYNRTKGRYRNKHGGAANSAASSDGAANAASSTARTHHHQNYQEIAPQPVPQTYSKQQTKAKRSKLDESVLLLNEPLVQPSYFHHSTSTTEEDETYLFSNTERATLDLASMAATLSATSLSQRLQVPAAVADSLAQVLPASAVTPLPPSESKVSAGTSSTSQSITSRKAKADNSLVTRGPRHQTSEARTIQDDSSFSVAHTRLKVGLDGQVEARPKPGTYPISYAKKPPPTKTPKDSEFLTNTLSMGSTMTSVSSHTLATLPQASTQAQLQQASHRATPVSEEDEDSSEGDSGIDRYMVVPCGKRLESEEDGTEDDRYPPTTAKLPPTPAATAAPRLAAKPSMTEELETASFLDNWLDQAMLSKSEEYAKGPPETMIHHIPMNTPPPTDDYEDYSDDYEDYSQGMSVAIGDHSVDSMSTITMSKSNRLPNLNLRKPNKTAARQKNHLQSYAKGQRGPESKKPPGGEDLDAWLDSVIS